MHSHKTNSPNPLPNPDITDTGYLHQHPNKLNITPSLLENIQENYNLRTSSAAAGEMVFDNDRYKYSGGVNGSRVGGSMVDVDRENIYGRKKDYQDNYGEYDANGGLYLQQQVPNVGYQHTPSHYGGSEKDYGPPNTHIVNQMRGYPSPQLNQQMHQQHQENMYHIYDKRPSYLGANTESPYMSKERIHTELYSPRDNQPYGLQQQQQMYGSGNGSGVGVAESVGSVHSMLKNDYQVTIHVFSPIFGLLIDSFQFYSNAPSTITRIGCQKLPTRMGIFSHTPRRRITLAHYHDNSK